MVTNNGVFRPLNENELIFFIFSGFYNAGVFGVSINILGIILANIAKKSSVTKNDLKVLDRYMEKKNINKNLKTRILHYISYKNEYDKYLNMDET